MGGVESGESRGKGERKRARMMCCGCARPYARQLGLTAVAARLHAGGLAAAAALSLTLIEAFAWPSAICFAYESTNATISSGRYVELPSYRSTAPWPSASSSNLYG